MRDCFLVIFRSILKYPELFYYNNNKICLWIFSLRPPLALGVEASKRYERNCEIYFIVSVVLAQQLLAGLGKIAGKQSLVLWIHDVQKCTRALRQKNTIMKTLNNMSENQRNIFLSCRWKLDALQDFNLFETPILRWILIDLIEGQV